MSVQWERDEAAKVAVIADRIRRFQATCDFDYRSLIPKDILKDIPQLAEDYHVAYGKNKYAVASR